MNLSKDCKITRVSNAVAAGQATTNCTAVDMVGFDSVTFVALIGAIVSTGTVTVKAQQSSDNGSTDAFSDLEGTALAYTDADDNKVAVLEIRQPQKRYVRAVITTATANGTIDGVLAMQTHALAEPVTQSTTVVGAELHLAPAEGTA